MKSRSIRTLAVLASAGLLVGAFAVGPADAAKRKKKKPFSCAPATPAAPASEHAGADAAPEAEVTPITEAATEEAPVVIEYEHGPAMYVFGTAQPIQEDNAYFNLQVVSNKPDQGLYILQEWGTDITDLDLYLYDDSGTQVAFSGAFNAAPQSDTPIGDLSGPAGTGGAGFESISGFPAVPCAPHTIESVAYMTHGEPVTLKAWLGPVGEYNAPAE
ncbi:MAG TPA: hypothetical protein VJ927_05350 [Actinomycetota bacterium]|nr:hypothetical protein [Actinomycetota bacterium]